MFESPLFFCVMSALCFGVWPIVSRIGNVGTSWSSVLVVFGALLTTSVGLFFSARESMPLTRGGAIVLVAGVLNGVGFLFFGKLMQWKDRDVSQLLPIVFALMPVFTLAAAALLLHEPVTAKKLAGIALAGAAVWLLH